jgi:6-phospho-beta-glucosidase
MAARAMRIAVLGANSFSTPCLIRYLSRHEDIVPLTVALAGRTPDRLAAVARASRIVAARAPIRIEMTSPGQSGWKDCVAGAQMVVVQVRVGGYEARRYEETSPLEFAGATGPVRVSGPGPVGICELPFTTLCGLAQLDGQYPGINHIGWPYDVRNPRTPNAPPRPAVGLKSVRLEEAKEEILAAQEARPGGRAADLAALAPHVIDAYASGSTVEVERAWSMRCADWYD